MKRGRMAAVAMVLVAGGAPVPAAPEVRLSAFIEPAQGMTDTRPMRLVIQVEGADLPDVSVPSLPPLTNLRVVSGPDQSRRYRWVNGRSTSSLQLLYTLLAERPGPAEVPAITVRLGGTAARTEPIRFQVGEGPRAVVPPGRRSSPREDAEADVVLEARLGAAQAWVGQPLSLDVTLYSPVQITRYGWTERPELQDFWIEDVPTRPGADADVATKDGRRMNVYPLHRAVLVPNRPGTITIPSFGGRFQFRSAPGDVFTDFFNFGRERAVVRKSEPLRLQVRGLPAEGRPADFAGATGRFRLQSSLDRSDPEVNQAVSFEVTVEGEGLLKSVPAPRLEFPALLRAFEPQVSESSSVVSGILKSRKTWEWVVIPLAAGEVAMPEVRFPYFDVSTGRYEVARDTPVTLAVRPGTARTEDVASPGRADLAPVRRDIVYIKPLEGSLRRGVGSGRAGPIQLALLALLALPVGLLPLAVVLGRRRARLGRDRSLARSRRARARARRRLRHAERKLGQLGPEAFHQEVARALVEYVADRFDRSPAGLTYDLADELLGSRGVDPTMRRRFRATLESCDFARFVPAASRPERKSEVLQDAAQVLDHLEKAL